MKIKNKKVTELKKVLPKKCRIYSSKQGLVIFVNCLLDKDVNLNKLNFLIKNAVKKLHLEEVYAGTGRGFLDYTLVDLESENQLVADTKQLHSYMKSFFKKWHNAYCESDKAYDYIEKMRAMIETDEA